MHRPREKKQKRKKEGNRERARKREEEKRREREGEVRLFSIPSHGQFFCPGSSFMIFALTKSISVAIATIQRLRTSVFSA